MHRWHTAGRLVPVKLTERVFRYRRSDVDRLMDAK
jgi:predicted site-specific integrase-resolvase